MMKKRTTSVAMRPDAGRQMPNDFKQKTKPGYPAIESLKGLAKFNDLEPGILESIEG